MGERKQNNKKRGIRHVPACAIEAGAGQARMISKTCADLYYMKPAMSFINQGERGCLWNGNIQSTSLFHGTTSDKQRHAAKNRTNKEVLNAEL